MWVCVLVLQPQVAQASQSQQDGTQQVNSQSIMPCQREVKNFLFNFGSNTK